MKMRVTRVAVMGGLLGLVGVMTACEYTVDYETVQCIEDNALCPWVPDVCQGKGDVLTGADLYGSDLSGADLRCADLRGADLYGADLRGVDLYGADLRGADLYGADLSNTDLRHADLRCADLYGANFSGARVGGANVAAADLYGVDLGEVRGDLTNQPSGDKSCRPDPELGEDGHHH